MLRHDACPHTWQRCTVRRCSMTQGQTPAHVTRNAGSGEGPRTGGRLWKRLCEEDQLRYLQPGPHRFRACHPRSMAPGAKLSPPRSKPCAVETRQDIPSRPNMYRSLYHFKKAAPSKQVSLPNCIYQLGSIRICLALWEKAVCWRCAALGAIEGSNPYGSRRALFPQRRGLRMLLRRKGKRRRGSTTATAISSNPQQECFCPIKRLGFSPREEGPEACHVRSRDG